jgi:hypothetical protein
VIGNDPAALFASVERVSRIRSFISPQAELILVENAPQRGGIPTALLHEEFNAAVGLAEDAWAESAIPYCSNAGRWPASGETMASLGQRSLKAALLSLLAKMKISHDESAYTQGFVDKALEQLAKIPALISGRTSSACPPAIEDQNSKKLLLPLKTGNEENEPPAALEQREAVRQDIGRQEIVRPALVAINSTNPEGKVIKRPEPQPAAEELNLADLVRPARVAGRE